MEIGSSWSSELLLSDPNWAWLMRNRYLERFMLCNNRFDESFHIVVTAVGRAELNRCRLYGKPLPNLYLLPQNSFYFQVPVHPSTNLPVSLKSIFHDNNRLDKNIEVYLWPTVLISCQLEFLVWQRMYISKFPFFQTHSKTSHIYLSFHF